MVTGTKKRQDMSQRLSLFCRKLGSISSNLSSRSSLSSHHRLFRDNLICRFFVLARRAFVSFFSSFSLPRLTYRRPTRRWFLLGDTSSLLVPRATRSWLMLGATRGWLMLASASTTARECAQHSSHDALSRSDE